MASAKKYDRENIWIAPDGGGGFYAYDSEAEAIAYCEKNDEEGPDAILRGELDKNSPEMFVLLHHLDKMLQNGVDLESLHRMKSRVQDVVKATRAQKGLKKILHDLNIQDPK